MALRSLTLADGVAIADFSKELAAYGGDSQRASRIHAQVTRTLLEFPAIHDVLITIEGQHDRLLEPQAMRLKVSVSRESSVSIRLIEKRPALPIMLAAYSYEHP